MLLAEWLFSSSLKQAVAVARVAFTKEALKRPKESLAVGVGGRSTAARAGMTGESCRPRGAVGR